jgi:putative FmdB family regulatory protein
MPTYDYRCPNCHTQFQAQHAMTAAKPDCPACGAPPDQVILSAPAVHGNMARGREAASRTFEKQEISIGHGPGCPCCH